MLHVKHRFKNSYSHWQLNLQFTQLNYDYNKRLLAAMHINWIRRRFISTSSINELVGHNDFIPNFVYRAHFLIYTTSFARNVIHIAISSVAYWIQQLNSSFDIISCSTIISNTLTENVINNLTQFLFEQY